MSKSTKSAEGRLIVGKAVPMPEYRYQVAWGSSASVSASGPKKEERTFRELQNFVPHVG